MTRGITQTAEEVTLPNSQRMVVYSSGDAREIDGSKSTNPPLELSLTDQCADFPLPLLVSFLDNRDEAFKYVGQETLAGEPVQHVRVWDTLASSPRLSKLAPFTVRDIWLDAASHLPVKIGYKRHLAGGAAPAFRIDVSYRDFVNSDGTLYPTQIKKTFDGTPWQSIAIQSIVFNTGLPDSDFSVE